jgi:hypothetical protein
MNISPCRYRTPFVAQRGWIDSLAITSYFFTVDFPCSPPWYSSDNCSLLRPPSRAFLPSSPLKRSPSLCHRRRSVVRQQRPARINIFLCLVSFLFYVYGSSTCNKITSNSIIIASQSCGSLRNNVWYIKLVPKFFHLLPDFLGWFTHWGPFRQAAKSSNCDFSDQHWDPW